MLFSALLDMHVSSAQNALYSILTLTPCTIHTHRYERKKNIELAISALQQFKSLRSGVKGLSEKKGLLVIAGGYDLRVEENVQYLEVS